MAGWTSSGSSSNALNHLCQATVLPNDIRRSLQERDWGLFGVLSIKGGHSEGATQGTIADSEAVALYCLRWTHGATEYLLNALDDWQSKSGGRSQGS